MTAGNFVDLCMRGFFNGLPLAFDELSAPADGRVLSMSAALVLIRAEQIKGIPRLVEPSKKMLATAL